MGKLSTSKSKAEKDVLSNVYAEDQIVICPPKPIGDQLSPALAEMNLKIRLGVDLSLPCKHCSRVDVHNK